MGDHLTSITLKDIAKLKEPRETYLDLLRFDEKEVQEKIANSTPIVKVLLTRLEPKHIFFSDAKNLAPILKSPQYEEAVVTEKELFDLEDLGRAMCLAIGRYAHNHFRTFVDKNDVDMDPFVSREHGLIFLNKRSKVCYHDIGTFKKGSTNGTKLNDISVVKNEITNWDENDYFGFGECISTIKNGERIMESRFKLRFQKIE